jgi:hypothetical protein
MFQREGFFSPLASQIEAINVRKPMDRIVPNDLPPDPLNLDLQLEGEFYDAPSLTPVVMPDPGIGPHGQDVSFLGQ